MNEKIEFNVCGGDFKHVFGRSPTEDEFDEFVRLVEKGIESQIGWDVIYECIKQEMKLDKCDVCGETSNDLTKINGEWLCPACGDE